VDVPASKQAPSTVAAPDSEPSAAKPLMEDNTWSAAQQELEQGQKTAISNFAFLHRLQGEAEDPPCLVVIHGPTELGKRYPLEPAETPIRIGRADDCAIVIEGDSVSRRHAALALEDKAWWLRDANSTNGTYCNAARIESRRLVSGDQIKVGPVLFKFLAGSDVEAKYHEEIYRLTIHDGLTQLHNRRYFLEHFERELTRALRHERSLCLVMFDVDQLAELNEAHGKDVGDEALQRLAEWTQARIRRDEMLARVGGDSFALVLPESTLGEGVELANRLRQGARELTLERASAHRLSISCGVVAVPEDGKETSSLLELCEARLRFASRAGGDRVIGHEPITPISVDREARQRCVAAARFLEDLQTSMQPVGATDRPAHRRLVAVRIHARAKLSVSHTALALDGAEEALLGAFVGAVAPGDRVGRFDGGVLVGVLSLSAAATKKWRERLRQAFGEQPALLGDERVDLDIVSSDLDERVDARTNVADLLRRLDAASTGATRLEHLALPIAVRRRLVGAATNEASRMLRLTQLAETLVRFLLAVGMADALRVLPSRERELIVACVNEKFAGPTSLGTLLQLILTVYRALQGSDRSFVRDLASALIGPSGKPRDTFRELAEFVPVRNDLVHGRLREEDLASLSQRWTERIDEVLAALPLAGVQPFLARSASITDKEGTFHYQYAVWKLVGDHPVVPMTEMSWTRPIETQRVLVGEPEGESALCVEPFVVARCADDGAPTLGFLLELQGDKVRFADAVSLQPMDLGDADRERLQQRLKQLGMLQPAGADSG
jgi:diguanylate cyclase (GGDEF)-like protein